MKKQDNEGLIQEIRKRLDWYTMEASDEEFDADEVQNLLKLLDSLTPEEEKDKLSGDEVVENFWKYCAEREEEERILAEEEITEPEKKKNHKVLTYFRRHKAAAVAAVVVVAMVLSGSWQMAVNAEKHGGFFWWMDKSEEGTTKITVPEMDSEDSQNRIRENYYSIEDVPEMYKTYVEIPFEIMNSYEDGYSINRIEIVKANQVDTIYVFFQKGIDEILHFEIKIYEQEILRVRENYQGYTFYEVFEYNQIPFNVFQKDEDNGKQRYAIHFYYGKVKYAVAGNDLNMIKEIAKKYEMMIVNNHIEN